MDPAGRGLASLNGIDHDHFAVTDQEIEERKPHFAGFHDIDLVSGLELPGNEADDVEAHPIIAKDVISQAEDEDGIFGAAFSFSWTKKRILG